MTYIELDGDLFSAPKEYWKAQCIASDFICGSGIAVEFNKRYNVKRELLCTYAKNWYGYGYCVATYNSKVFNLVTKKYSFWKPTYETFRESLISMRGLAKINDVHKIATYRLGCCRDKLEYEKVREIIHEVFDDTDIEFVVYTLK